MDYLIYLLFGLIPSIIWLLYFLQKDLRPESKLMIIKVFLYGMLAAFPAIFFGMALFKIFRWLNIPPPYLVILDIFVAVAFIEEMMKFLVVRDKVLSHPEFDEPIDAVIYMITAALGFAAFENILVLLGLGLPVFLPEVLGIATLRFLTATFLHALCSGIIGYFLALGIFETKKRLELISLGLLIGTILHGVYNFAILEIEEVLSFLIPLAILIGSAIFLSFGFKRLKKMKSVCKIY